MTAAKGAPRRRKGEGSISRHHNHPTCPPAVAGERPAHKCKGLWRARLTVTVRGRKVAKVVYGKTEAEVVKKKAALLLNESQGRVSGGGAKPTVKQWIEEWFEDAKQDLKVNSWQSYRSRMDAWIIPQLGHIRLDRLTDEDIEAMYSVMRRKGLAEGTLRQVHAVLGKSLKVARKRRLITFNPCEDVQAPSQKARAPRRPLEVGEALRVLEVSGDDPRPAIALLTGLRQGEALASRWCDLHLDGTPAYPIPHLVVAEARSRQWGVGFVYHDPKSDTSKGRVVPLVPEVVARLRKAQRTALLNGAAPDARVFRSSRGTPVTAKADLLSWYAYLDAAGVERTPLHAARNTVAGLLQNAKIDVVVVAAILGHADVSMTAHYQRGNREAVTTAMQALDAYLKENGSAA